MKLTKSHRSYFKAAKAMSELSNYKQHHLGCVAVYQHKIISSGYNSNKTNPTQKKLNACRFTEETPHTVHSELACLLPLIGRGDIDFNRVQLYIWRNHANGNPALARPCKSCMQLIKELGIRHVYYTNDGGYSHEEILY